MNFKTSENYARQWTLEAIDCYFSRCDCSKCLTIKQVESINKKTCKMKKAVIELVRKFGIPTEETITALKGGKDREE